MKPPVQLTTEKTLTIEIDRQSIDSETTKEALLLARNDGELVFIKEVVEAETVDYEILGAEDEKFKSVHYKTLLAHARTSFEQDLDNLGINFPKILSLNKYQALNNDPNVFQRIQEQDYFWARVETAGSDSLVIAPMLRVLENNVEYQQLIQEMEDIDQRLYYQDGWTDEQRDSMADRYEQISRRVSGIYEVEQNMWQGEYEKLLQFSCAFIGSWSHYGLPG